MTQEFTIFNTRSANLVLSNGQIFTGRISGAAARITTAELVYNTTMTDYQQALTSSSGHGGNTIVTFTYPHIGNTGITPDFAALATDNVAGIIAVEIARNYSNWHSKTDIETYMQQRGISALTGVDTRALTHMIRQEHQAGRTLVGSFGTAPIEELEQAVNQNKGMN